MRDGVGGGVEWYNMQTKEHGGIRQGFEDSWVMEMKAVGDYIALGCRKISGSSPFEIRMLNTKTKKIDYIITPDPTISAVGEWINFQDENLLISSRSQDGQANLININVIQNKVIYNKNLGISSNIGIYEDSKGAYSIVLNDGFGYLNARGNIIMRFDPNNGNIEPALKYNNYSSKFEIYKDKIYFVDTQSKELPFTTTFGFKEADTRERINITSVDKGNTNFIFKTTSTDPFNLDVSLLNTTSGGYMNNFFYDNTTITDNDKITLVMTIKSIKGGDVIINAVEYDPGASAVVKAGETKTVELTVGVLAHNQRVRVSFDLAKMIASEWTMTDIHIKKELPKY